MIPRCDMFDAGRNDRGWIIWKCEKCHQEFAFRSNKTPVAWCSVSGAGDMIAAVLEKLGIKPCSGCRQRKRLANRLGRAIGIGRKT